MAPEILWNGQRRKKRRLIRWRGTFSAFSLCLLVMTVILLGVGITDAQEEVPQKEGTSSPTDSSSLSSLRLKDSEKLSGHDHHDHHHDHGHHNHSHTDDDEAFCRGMYMVMFTDGFRWSLASNTDTNTTSTPPCLAYYVASWKLSMSGKFRGAMVFSFLLALLTEGLSVSRFTLIQYLHVFAGNNNNNNNNRRSRKHKLVLTIVYALQQWLGTMIMLVSMMYSIEMLLSVVAGLCLGNFVFVRDHPDKRQRLDGIGIGSSRPLPPSASVGPFQHPGGDSGSSIVRGCNSNAAATGSTSLPGVNRRSNTTAAGSCAGGVCADIDEERQSMLTPTSMDGTESSLEMPTRKED